MKLYSNKLIHFSVIISLLLMLIPWSGYLKLVQPYWLALVVIYWSLEAPKQFGLAWGFFYSILLDVLYGSLLGKHGVSIVAMVFLVQKMHKRLKMTSFWQLSLIVGALFLNDAVIRTLIDFLTLKKDLFKLNLWSVTSSILVWPWFKYFMDRLRLRHR